MTRIAAGMPYIVEFEWVCPSVSPSIASALSVHSLSVVHARMFAVRYSESEGDRQREREREREREGYEELKSVAGLGGNKLSNNNSGKSGQSLSLSLPSSTLAPLLPSSLSPDIDECD